MIISKLGRYAVLLQFIALLGSNTATPLIDAQVDAAPSIGAGGGGVDDANHHRILQDTDCSTFNKKQKCPSPQCSWTGSGPCVAVAAPTPQPTDPPVAVPPTDEPTPNPTAPPTLIPTSSPTTPGAGYCSDNPGMSCMSTSVCACAATRNLLSTPARNMSSDGGININHRALQSCSSATKRNTCHNISGCIWQNQNNVCQSSTSQPTDAPTGAVTSSPTDGPTRKPSESPVTDQPTGAPSPCACLGLDPTKTPTPEPTNDPSVSPTKSPSDAPTPEPSNAPTKAPTLKPSNAPSVSPTKLPTNVPTSNPTNIPTKIPTSGPSKSPSVSPTKSPTDEPTSAPSNTPTKKPTPGPSNAPSLSPTKSPTDAPTKTPTIKPTNNPSKAPSVSPSTANPTDSPSTMPTSPPSTNPTDAPSKSPTNAPTNSPNGSVINGVVGVPIVPHASDTMTVTLPPSEANKLITMSQVSADNDDEVPVSRSYDGNPWETLHPLLMSVDCSAGCLVEIPPHSGAAMHYIIQEYTPPAKTTAQDFARLLLQGTYGPTQTSLSEAMTSGSAASWVQDEINKPASLLRAHYRERANGSVRNDMYHYGTRLACEPGSRWNRYAFNRWRDIGKTIVEESTGTGSWYLKIDGIIRTEVATQPSAQYSLPSSYVICRNDVDFGYTQIMSSFVEAPSGEKGMLLVAAVANQCSMSAIAIDMPGVEFSNPDPASVPTVNLVSLSDPNVFDAKILQDIISPSTCDNFKITWPNFVKNQASGIYYIEDRRVELYDNTDGASTVKKRLLNQRCPQVPKTFVNEETCVVRSDCTAPVFSGDFELNAANLRKFYQIDGKYVYRIQNLPLIDTASPCNTNSNRFVRKDAEGDSSGCGIDDSSGDFPTIVAAINTFLSPSTVSEQDKKLVIDLVDTSLNCTDATNDALGASFTVTIPGSDSPSCWTHTYEREWSVYTFNDWVVNHPGNPKRFRQSKPNPIAHVAEHENTGPGEDSVTLSFPSFHWRNFHDNRWRLDRDLVGSWGDRISFNSLPDTAKSEKVITLGLGGTVVADSGEVIEVCGSPGEVGNQPSRGHQYLLQKDGDAGEETPDTLDQDHERWHSNKMVWNTVALTAPDQLRHRVAWALSSIFVVTENDISLDDIVEAWAVYYDIFVRHAFGSSFFTVLKEIALSPLMGRMLTYEGSKSLAYNVERNGAFFYPDENFAREIMQLFSIGLWMLNPDGTKKKDQITGKAIPTYSNDDIMNFSRGWTNFVLQNDERDNIEAEWNQGWMTNRVDPMTLPSSEGRDFFPKQTLLVDGKRGYIGDKILRCDAMPDKPWLRKGAIWEFRENSQSLMGKQDPDWWADPETWTPRLVLDSSGQSELYNKLCSFDGSKCDFQSTVVLDVDIDCYGTCSPGRAIWDWVAAPTNPCECSIDEPRTVRIDLSPTQTPVWYEYKRAPCVQVAFPETGSMNSVKEVGSLDGYGNKAMCADSRYPVAGTTCCDSNGPINICVFKGERTTYNTAVDRCASYGVGYSTCSWETVPVNWDCGTDTGYWQDVQSSAGMRFSWTSDTCSMSVQINQDGKVAIIHSINSNTVKERVGIDTGTYFGVFWDSSGDYPKASSNCEGITGCQVHGNTCICTTSVQTTPQVFDGSQVPTASELSSQLHFGATDPSLFGAGHYSLCAAPICSESEYNIHSRIFVDSDADYANAFDDETIFEVTDPVTGLTSFLSNSKSSVDIGGGYTFRNPPMYNSPIDPTQRDGLYETDDILQHYVRHPNTAPFIAKNLIRHLITSNPSPRFVEVVADAFRTGSYSSDGIDFGSGGYGDLEAAVAAIMLDSEARSTTLDDDANHGRAREPLLKILNMYRSMELSTSSGANREIDMVYLMERGIGQEAFRAPSVFSFFLPEYQPVGPVLNKGLVAPETQLFDAPKLLGFINGLFSLPLFGLTDCWWWQGFGEWRSRYWLPDYPDGGVFNCEGDSWLPDLEQFEDPGVPLQLRWKPPSWGGQTNVLGASVSAVIDDIDLLLTGGRLYPASRTVLEQVYTNAATAAGSNPDNAALKVVLQHYSAIPEYHITNNLVDSSYSVTEIRPVPDITTPPNPPPVEGYKAILYLFMAGAADSYSMLIPNPSCSLYSDYVNVRGDVAITSSRTIDASTSNQPCNSFDLHPSLANIHALYGTGDAAWISNIGPLVEPLDKTEFEAGSKPVPQALFAHNTQTQVTQAVFAQDGSAGGVLGRIGDALNAQEGEEIFAGYSISGTPKILEGAPGVSRPSDVLSGGGVASFNSLVWPYEDNIEQLSQHVVTSIHGETFSASMTNAIYRMRKLEGVVGTTTLANNDCFDGLETSIADQFHQVARLTKNRDGLEASRDVFYTSIGGFDTHSDNGDTLTGLLTEIDDAIGCFKTAMDDQGIWNNVTIVSASEFGRTLTSNGLGTDHAWGGNHFFLGGNVKGGIIHGQYPDDLTETGSLNIGRGRLVPTTPWEGVWNALAEWFGVTSENIATVLPNIQNFQSNIFSEADMFE